MGRPRKPYVSKDYSGRIIDRAGAVGTELNDGQLEYLNKYMNDRIRDGVHPAAAMEYTIRLVDKLDFTESIKIPKDYVLKY